MRFQSEKEVFNSPGMVWTWSKHGLTPTLNLAPRVSQILRDT